jgi:hypothetical protein
LTVATYTTKRREQQLIMGANPQAFQTQMLYDFRTDDTICIGGGMTELPENNLSHHSMPDEPGYTTIGGYR